MAGNLDRLPLEIRRDIYYYLFQPSFSIQRYITRNRSKVKGTAKARLSRAQACDVAISGHHRNAKHRGQIWDPSHRRWIPAPPGMTSILHVSRQVSGEVSQTLYGCSTFCFDGTQTLFGFLAQTRQSKQYIRHIYIRGELKKRDSWASLDRCAASLVSATSLRTLRFDYDDFFYHDQTCTLSKFPTVKP